MRGSVILKEKNTSLGAMAVKLDLKKNLLGIRSTTHFNLAALAKLGWNCLTYPISGSSLLIITKKYLRSESFFST